MPYSIFTMGEAVSGSGSGKGTGTFDPYAGTKKPRGSLARRDEIRKKIRPSLRTGKRNFKNRIKGNSMRPKYQNGSNAVTDTDYPFEDLRVGDDVTFIHDNGDGSESYFTHRIEGVLYDITGAPIYKTKGTNNRNPDRGLMSKNDYIGKTISEKEFYAGVK